MTFKDFLDILKQCRRGFHINCVGEIRRIRHRKNVRNAWVNHSGGDCPLSVVHEAVFGFVAGNGLGYQIGTKIDLKPRVAGIIVTAADRPDKAPTYRRAILKALGLKERKTVFIRRL